MVDWSKYPNDDNWDKRGRGSLEDFERTSKAHWDHIRSLFGLPPKDQPFLPL